MVTNLSMGVIEADIRAARRALESYNISNNKYDKNISAYHIQQAVEKLIKIQIYSIVGGSSVNRALYTHNIDALILFCESHNLSCIIPKYVRENSARISEWEVSGRYDLRFSVNVKSLENALEVTVVWFKQLCSIGFR